jgi:hypothetical protein
MVVKSILLAVILCLGPVLQAQSSGAEREGGLGSEPIVEPRVVLGAWADFHVAFCYLDANGVFEVQTVEGPFIRTPDIFDVSTLSPSCQTGNRIAIFVTAISGQSFLWSSIVTYPFK